MMLFHVKHNGLIYNKMRNVEILLFVAFVLQTCCILLQNGHL
jgi:hypothetical protein